MCYCILVADVTFASYNPLPNSLLSYFEIWCYISLKIRLTVYKLALIKIINKQWQVLDTIFSLGALHYLPDAFLNFR
jgi:hypothetical protein